MTEFEETAIHEAGHAVVWLLEEEHIGPLGIVTALPNGESLGYVMQARHAVRDASNPRTLRALGRLHSAGFIAERIAGGGCPSGFRSDAKKLAKMVLFVDHGDRFLGESVDGAEWQLRCNWGAVEGIAALLMRLGVLTEPHGIGLARMELQKPPRPRGIDEKTLMRLLGGIENIPELAEPIRAALRGMLPPAPRTKARKTKPPRRRYTRSTASYLDPTPGIVARPRRRTGAVRR
jgi:hypothetical protein